MPKGPEIALLAAGIVLVLVGLLRFPAHMPLIGAICVLVGLALVATFFWIRKKNPPNA
jgi:hypothetical protein